MLKLHIQKVSDSFASRFLLPKLLVPVAKSSSSRSSSSLSSLWFTKPKKHIKHRVNGSGQPGRIKAVLSVAETSLEVRATVTVKQTIGGLITSLGIEKGLDDIKDMLGRGLLLELVSAELDPETGLEKPTIKSYAHKGKKVDEDIQYEAEFKVPPDFGMVGAVFVENEHRKEMFLDDIVIDGLPYGPIRFTCGSWVRSNSDKKQKRVFFSNKSYLPSETPEGLKRLREEELVLLRGNGQGERKIGDRIYDYDVYNDLGDPDGDHKLARPVLGGKERPYPRRCRTGRPRCDSDQSAEKRKRDFYVPRDEAFSEMKQMTFSTKTLYSLFHALIPSLGCVIGDQELGFSYFKAIDSLFHEGIHMPPLSKKGVWNDVLPKLFKAISDGTSDVLRFETPPPAQRDKFFWMRDQEFSRQLLSGINPCSIRLVTEWPMKSELDPQLYGPSESAITSEIIDAEIGGIMKVEKAIRHRKLFVLDYHDILMPFVTKVRELKGTTLYGSRTLFFLNPDGTLRPLAIELTRPPMHGKHQWKQVYTPSWHSTGHWLWKLAKAHVLAHDSCYHQLVSHWLRTHCCAEPYIIATNRQLSAVHPIYRLLHPHFRYTMEVNALARDALINAGGIIESSFSGGKYCMEMCSAAYDKLWRFDHQALPQDLLSRGMAIEDLTSPHGLKLTVEDYPFATDGLLLWDAIKQWVTEYVSHYYPESGLIKSDQELQAWWTEIRTVGHGDKKDEPWWPELNTRRDLIDILTTIVWVTSGLHAAVNFGQYAYAGYFPNRPTIARIKMPTEDPSPEEWNLFLEKPETVLLATFPSKLQATRVMAVLHVLSNHSPDEEYIGEEIESAWADEPVIKAAFEKFSGRLKAIEGIIDERNTDTELRNRNGAGIVPYQFLKPFSKPGVTGQGVPYSISI